MSSLREVLLNHASSIESLSPSLSLSTLSESLALVVADMRASLCENTRKSKSDDETDVFEIASQYVFCLRLLEERTCLSFPSYMTILEDFDPSIKTRCDEFTASFSSAEKRPIKFNAAAERERRRTILQGIPPEKGVILVQSLVNELVGLVKITLEDDEDENDETCIHIHPTFISSGPHVNMLYESIDIDDDEKLDARKKIDFMNNVSSSKSTCAKILSIHEPPTVDSVSSFPQCVMVIDSETVASRFTFRMS